MNSLRLTQKYACLDSFAWQISQGSNSSLGLTIQQAKLKT